MKTKIRLLSILLFFIFNQLGFSQEEPRYELTLNTEYSGVKNKIKLSNISYNLGNYVYGAIETNIDVKPEPSSLSFTFDETINKDFFKFFESQKRKLNGFIEIKDNFGKNPTRKIEFKNAFVIFSETLAIYGSANSTSLLIYTDSLIIDGACIFSK